MEDATAKYHSRFGGLWIDREDWADQLHKRSNRFGHELTEDLQTFVRDGFVILRGAANHKDIDAYAGKITDAYANGSDDLIMLRPGEMIPRRIEPGMEARQMRLVDAHTSTEAALRLLSTPRLVNFLRTIFSDDPLLTQSLTFYKGSEQGIHRDTAYVVVNGRPLALAACWIALEDVRAGSGELIYLKGSHRYPESDFFNGKKHWNPEADGNDAHNNFLRWIADNARERGQVPEQFLARKGDILVWHADLAHGGAPIADPSLTRKSLVGHFCPVSAGPDYFVYRDDRRATRTYNGLTYSSMYVDLRENPPPPPNLLQRIGAKLKSASGVK